MRSPIRAEKTVWIGARIFAFNPASQRIQIFNGFQFCRKSRQFTTPLRVVLWNKPYRPPVPFIHDTPAFFCDQCCVHVITFPLFMSCLPRFTEQLFSVEDATQDCPNRDSVKLSDLFY